MAAFKLKEKAGALPVVPAAIEAAGAIGTAPVVAADIFIPGPFLAEELAKIASSTASDSVFSVVTFVVVVAASSTITLSSLHPQTPNAATVNITQNEPNVFFILSLLNLLFILDFQKETQIYIIL